MVQMAARRGIDFQAANFRGRWWWLGVCWQLNCLEDENYCSIMKLQHAQHSSVLDYALEKETFNNHWNAANKILRDTHNTYFPWMKKEESKKSDVDGLMAAWKIAYGDPNDPAVMAKYKKVAEALRRKAEKGRSSNFNPQQKMKENMKKVLASRNKRKKK